MASVVLSDTGPALFTPDVNTPNGMYINSSNRFSIVIGDATLRQIVELTNVGAVLVTDVTAFAGQIREMAATDLVSITG